jgi:hypothetical protein
MALCFDTLCVSLSIGSRLFLPSRPEKLFDCRTTFHPPDKGPWPRDTSVYSQSGRVASLPFASIPFLFWLL